MYLTFEKDSIKIILVKSSTGGAVNLRRKETKMKNIDVATIGVRSDEAKRYVLSLPKDIVRKYEKLIWEMEVSDMASAPDFKFDDEKTYNKNFEFARLALDKMSKEEALNAIEFARKSEAAIYEFKLNNWVDAINNY